MITFDTLSGPKGGCRWIEAGNHDKFYVYIYPGVDRRMNSIRRRSIWADRMFDAMLPAWWVVT